MKSPLLDAPATPERLRALREAGVLSAAGTRAALEVALGPPPPAAWRRFLDEGLLALGGLLVLAGVVYFFAFNWAGLGRFGKLGLLEAALTAAAVGAWRLWPRAAGQALLTAAAVLVGPLLAVYGQAYQTGADAWELFAGWAVLVLPWVALARSQPLWLLLLVLANVGLALHWEQVREGALEETSWLLPLLCVLDGAAWLTVEGLSRRGVAWLQGRWLPRLLQLMAAGTAAPLALLTVAAPPEATPASVAALLLALALVGGTLAAFRGPRQELFLLATAVALAVALLTALLGGAVLGRPARSEAGLLLLALALVAQLSLAAAWLRAQARQRPTEEP